MKYQVLSTMPFFVKGHNSQFTKFSCGMQTNFSVRFTCFEVPGGLDAIHFLDGGAVPYHWFQII